MDKTTHTNDHCAEEKIKEAARKLFTKKGFSAVKTREIAAEAGINLALLNYYFRSKEKLFQIIMIENLERFAKGIAGIMGNEDKSIDEKIEIIVNYYIDMLTENPNLPLFILNELRNDTSRLPETIDNQIQPVRMNFMNQIKESMQSNNNPSVNPMHMMANLMGLIIFPFAARPMLEKLGKFDDATFAALMLERKQLIPIWVKAMMHAT